MRRIKGLAAAAVVVALCAGRHGARAQAAGELAGSWQGTLDGDGGGARIVLKVHREGDAAHAAWARVAYNLDSGLAYVGRNTTEMSVEGDEVRFTIAPIGVVYDGRLSADRRSIAGQWVQGGEQHALTLVHAEGDAAWAIPAPVPAMPKGADPDWEVVVVRPTDPDDPHNGFHLRGREIYLEGRTVESLLLFGYGMHPRQLVNMPEWGVTERWDVKGVPDIAGQPSLRQMQSMARKALVERFGLETHTEQRELLVYALRQAKDGEKMATSDSTLDLPDSTDRENGGQMTVEMRNTSAAEIALMLTFFSDRPVVDRTGLTGRYDFQLRWTRDESRAPTDGSAAPSLFTAVQEQMGLKLEPEKTMADVMVIDRLEKPGAN
ncbi:MAG TPA: TIGR03435 family protein [Acidobacteriaceae bacterium]|nr:TIGR03435 family protein [Acidobacteriaceae bacterium]